MGVYVYEVTIPLEKRVLVQAPSMDAALRAASETLDGPSFRGDDEHAAKIALALRGPIYARLDELRARGGVEIREHEFRYEGESGSLISR